MDGPLIRQNLLVKTVSHATAEWARSLQQHRVHTSIPLLSPCELAASPCGLWLWTPASPFSWSPSAGRFPCLLLQLVLMVQMGAHEARAREHHSLCTPATPYSLICVDQLSATAKSMTSALKHLNILTYNWPYIPSSSFVSGLSFLLSLVKKKKIA